MWNTIRFQEALERNGGFPPSSPTAYVAGALVDAGAKVIRPAAPVHRAVPSTSVEIVDVERLRTGWESADRTLGGRTPGYGRKGTYLVTGEPGIGKSTLLLQHAAGILHTHPGECALYVSAEMPLDQCRSAVDRTGSSHDRLLLLDAKELDAIVAAMRSEVPAFVVVDSAQAIRDADSPAAAGSTTQILRCGNVLKDLASELRCALVFLGRVVKDQSAAGPRELEHLVDAVCHFDRVGAYTDEAGVRIPLSLGTERRFSVSKSRLGPSASSSLRMTADGVLVDFTPTSSP